jgi:small-conductance mechanosensitive channel
MAWGTGKGDGTRIVAHRAWQPALLTGLMCAIVQTGHTGTATLAKLGWDTRFGRMTNPEENFMNNIIYIVGLIVIVLFILGYFGLR